LCYYNPLNSTKIQAFKNIFSDEQIALASKLYETLSNEQRVWLSGYLAGFNQSGGLLDGSSLGENALGNVSASSNSSVAEKVKLTILYGTQTGNSKKVAEQATKLAESKGVEVVISGMQNYKLRNLKEEKNVLVVVSTHGEGEPPIAAEDFYVYIYSVKKHRN
jgi:sulfite reductase (NADPH) flavoprotein alpha-component